jgi:hypothetical protein
MLPHEQCCVSARAVEVSHQTMNEKQKPAAPHLKMKVVTEAKCFLSTETCLNKSYSGAIVVAEQSVCPALLIKKQKSNTAALKKWFESH